MIHACDACAAAHGLKTRVSDPEAVGCRYCGRRTDSLWSRYELGDWRLNLGCGLTLLAGLPAFCWVCQRLAAWLAGG
jgi:hypothetical protein